MNGSFLIGEIALTRFQELRSQHDVKQTQNQIQKNSNTSIELPAEITVLITGSDFWITAKSNRYKKLVRDGHLRNLLELAAIAQMKRRPANWFAKVCSVKAWERTLSFLKKLYNVREKAERVVIRIGCVAEGMKRFVYKQIWAGKNVERHAVAAQEIGKSRDKLFAYLCRQEEQG